MIHPVIVIHWNEPDRCAITVARFLTQCQTVHVLIVDNGSEEPARRRLRAILGPRVELLELPTNIGYGPAANEGIGRALRMVDSELLTLVPHDALPAEKCLERMIELFNTQPNLGLLGADFPESSRQRFDCIRGMRLIPAKPYPNGFNIALYPTGTLTMMRRKCISDIGLFDPRYFAYSEEHDLEVEGR